MFRDRMKEGVEQGGGETDGDRVRRYFIFVCATDCQCFNNSCTTTNTHDNQKGQQQQQQQQQKKNRKTDGLYL